MKTEDNIPYGIEPDLLTERGKVTHNYVITLVEWVTHFAVTKETFTARAQIALFSVAK